MGSSAYFDIVSLLAEQSNYPESLTKLISAHIGQYDPDKRSAEVRRYLFRKALKGFNTSASETAPDNKKVIDDLVAALGLNLHHSKDAAADVATASTESKEDIPANEEARPFQEDAEP